MRGSAMCRGVLIAAVLVLSSSRAQAETAEDMLSACRVVADAAASGEDLTLPANFNSGLCWGAFAAIQQATRLIPTPQSARTFQVCSPEQSTRTELVHVFLDYVHAHPERLHDDFFFVAVSALRGAFPCMDSK